MAVAKKTALPKIALKPKAAISAAPKMKATPLPATKAKPNIQNQILAKKTALATAKSAARPTAVSNATAGSQKAVDALRKQAVTTNAKKSSQRNSVIGSKANTIKPVRPLLGSIQDTKDAYNQKKNDYEKMIKERGGAGYGAQRSMQGAASSNRPKRARRPAVPKMAQYQDDEIKNTVSKQRRKSAAIKSYL